MVERKIMIRNRAGIHCRPASAILMAVRDFPNCRFRITCAKGESELDGVLSLLSLGLEAGDELTLRVAGPEAEQACARVAELLSREYDFPPIETAPAAAVPATPDFQARREA